MLLNDYKRRKRRDLKFIAILAITVFLSDVQIVYSQASTAQLQTRIKQLEAQVSDLQIIIGTLESLVKQGGATSQRSTAGSTSNSGGFGVQAGGAGGLPDRIEGLETQIRAISGQLERLAINVDNLTRNSANGSPGRQGALEDGSVYSGQNSGERIVSRELKDPNQFTTQSVNSGFGRLSVEPNGRNTGLSRPGSVNSGKTDQINSGQGGNTGQGNSRDRVASLGNESPKAIYDAAYGYLLSRDYTSAESTFKEFLKRYPNDKLAGNAQYWLGESFYVRGNYRKAADNFLKGYSKYRKNRKAPESLLKLAMSLKKLGQKEAACATFDELSAKFPKIEPRVKQRAEFEQRGAGCRE